MNRKEAIVHLEMVIKKLRNQLNQNLENLKRIQNSKELSVSDLYNGIENYISIETHHGNYEKSIGGDGRGAPSHETKHGFIVKVSLSSDYYFTEEHERAIRIYINSKYNADHIEILYSEIII